jgi:hypothetical protein
LGLGLLPLTLVTAVRLVSAPSSRAVALVGGAGGALIAAVAFVRPNYNLWLGGRNFLADDVYAHHGASGNALAIGLRPELLPTWAWVLLNGLAFLGSISLGIVALAYVRQRLRERAHGVSAPVLLLEVATLAYVGLIVVFGILGPLFNDRYLWPIVPAVAILSTRVATPPSAIGPVAIGARGASALTCASFAALSLVAVAYTQDSAAYDGARWRAGLQFVHEGAAPRDVDAGLEWIGAHSSSVENADGHGRRPITIEDPFFEGFWPPTKRCYVVSNERLDPARYAVVDTASYRSRLWTTERTLWRLRRLDVAGCA